MSPELAGSPNREAADTPLVTVIFPCLDEEEAIGSCVDAAWSALEAGGLAGEVIVVDNGSADRSREIAREHGARVVPEQQRGYGRAYLRGLAEARAPYVVMLDADGTYPAELIPRFVEMLEAGHDLVIGNRFAGAMEASAMPALNRYLGNPVLSGMTRLLFQVPLRDMHCGMRAVRADRARDLRLVTPGMEFATEMIVKALDNRLRVAEIDIPYRTRVGESKLMPWRDAWRHIEYMLIFSPAVLFLWPGAVLLAVGLSVQLAMAAGPVVLFGRLWDVHSSLAGVVAAVTGATLLGLGAVGSAYAKRLGMTFRESRFAHAVARAEDRPWRWLGGLALLVGGVIWGVIVVDWIWSGFGELAAVNVLALGSTSLAVGVELLGAAFIVSLIGLGRS